MKQTRKADFQKMLVVLRNLDDFTKRQMEYNMKKLKSRWVSKIAQILSLPETEGSRETTTSRLPLKMLLREVIE